MDVTQRTRQKRFKRFIALIVALAFFIPVIPATGKEASALPIPSDAVGQKGYKSDYDTRDEVSDAALATNIEVMEEGAVLLKNQDNILPLTEATPKVTLFGKRSTFPVYSGAGSSDQGGVQRAKRDPYDALRSAGFIVNPVAEAFYRDTTNDTGSGANPPNASYGTSPTTTGEMPAASAVGGWGNRTTVPDVDLNYDPAAATGSNYMRGGMRDSYADYDDAAILFVGRTGCENADGAKYVGASSGSNLRQGRYSLNDHYMQLDVHETNMIKEACYYFNKVIIILNSASALECGFLDDPAHYAYNANLKAAIWIGSPGENGFMALGGLLKGTVNPSGHLVDTYSRNFKNDPVFNNFGLSVPTSSDSNRYRTGASESGNWRLVEYQEGIYLGYRYHETRHAEILKLEAAEVEGVQPEGTLPIGSADEWYKENVVFPIGYGLSYTTFDWEVVGSKMDGASFVSGAPLTVKADSKFTIDVKVKNTGTREGKEVVQVYVETPYTPGEIEKATKVLIGFAKTKLLAPEAEQIVTIEIEAFYMASFDVFDKNGNEFFGYELESGAYKFHVSKDSHNAKAAVDFSIAAGKGLEIDKDPVTNNPIEILYPESNLYFVDTAKVLRPDNPSAFTAQNAQLLSRNNNFANRATETLTETRRYVSDAFIFNIGNTETGANSIGSGNDITNNSSTAHDWNTATDPNDTRLFVKHMERLFYDTGAPLIYDDYDTMYPGAHAERKTYEQTEHKFYDMWDWDYDDPRWDTVLNNLTWAQIAELVGSGIYGNAHIDSIGKPAIPDHDGPVGWTASDMSNGTASMLQMASTCVVGATYNRELAIKLGEIIGEEGIWGYYRYNAATTARIPGTSYSGWYAPGANIHRTAFSGRNFEYISEDAYLSGKMMGGIVEGAQNKGVYSYMKHFFLNDQELNRSATSSRGLVTWACEQTMRELYARAFEIAVKDATAHKPELVGIMSAYNRLGVRWATGDYNTMVRLLRDEWGFKGVVITDHTGDQAYQHTERAIFGGFSKILRANRRPVIKPEVLNFVGSATLPTQVLENASTPSATNLVTVPATSNFAKNFVPKAPIGNTYKHSLRRAMKDILFVTSKSNAINTAQLVMMSQSRLNLTTANNNADGIAKTWQVGVPVNYNLLQDTAAAYRPQVNYGDRNAVTYRYAVASGFSLPAGLTLLPNGMIVGTPTAATSGTTVIGIDVTTTSTHLPGYQQVTLPRIIDNGTVPDPKPAALFSGNSFVGIAPIGQAFTADISSGVADTYYSLLGSKLPAGLTLSADGLISGTPAEQDSGVFTFTVEAYNTGGVDLRVETKAFTIQIGLSGGGDQGKSAYEIAVENGFTGTETEWLASLKGEQGNPGESGKSAYEIFKELNPASALTEAQWIVSLTGAAGTPGAEGRGVVSIVKTGTSGNLDTYTITYTSGDPTIFTVTNGTNGSQGDPGTPGTPGTPGATGNGISKIEKTSTSGKVDTYTITYTNGDTTTFTVTNGNDAESSGGCGSSSASIVALFSLLAMAFVIVVKKQF